VSDLAKSIDALYFGYRPVAGHLKGCRLHGTDTWEVTRHTWESFSGEKYEETIRLACHECGVVHFRGPFLPGRSRGLAEHHRGRLGAG
jgi:hypothetical protein